MLIPRTKQLVSLLIKPAGPDCNLDCTYCFYLVKEELFGPGAHRMSLETLQAIIRQAMEEGGPQITFAWQGGEPTLMGMPWFQKAIEFQERYGAGKTVGNGLQTNGLLLDSTWARFLHERQFLVGLSIDGPAHVHDRYRIMRGGKGSFKTVAEKARLLLGEGVLTNALSVVTDYSAEYPEEIYAFLKELGFRFMQFIPCVERSAHDPSELAPYSVSADAYGRFLVRIFDLWLDDFADGAPTTSVRYFDSVFHKYVGHSAPECTLGRTCGTYLVVEYNGDAYSCDFYVEPRWRLGNVVTDSFSVMLNSELQTQFGEWKADLPAKCRACRWLRNCRGGCTKERNPRGADPSHFCRAYELFFEHADAKLVDLALRWRRQHSPAVPAQPVRTRP